MTGRDSLSVLRSLQRFFGRVMPAPWDVQVVRREPQQRPLLVVRFVPTVVSAGTAYVRRYTQPIEVLAYPPGVEILDENLVVTGLDPHAGFFQAEQTKDGIKRAIDSGSAVGQSKAMRIPLFDYTGVAIDAALPPGQEPLDYLVVSGLTASALPDPEDDGLFTVTVDFTVLWSDDGDRSRFAGAPLQDVSVGYVGTP